ncbi:MAG: Rrf2 family transcriptional regulator [Clostridiales bacterium]|nr:Rrf2 family transcriptional regulator [Clostridiales bacterium]
MKLSTKGRYGLKAMFDLALHYGDQPIALSSIAERRNISLSYLEQLISQLKKAGVVKSIRGAQGGYILTNTPDLITVGQVLRALEQLAPVECVTEGFDCDSSEFCVTRVIYKKILDSILETVDNITLQDMIDDYNEKKDSNSIVSSIQLFC